MANRDAIDDYKEPLKPLTKRVLLASVIFFHVGGGYALTLIEPTPLVIGDTAPMEVSFINSPPPSPPQAEPPPPEPPPELESMIEPPMPDLPPPVFPVVAPPPKPQPPKPPPPKPRVTTAPPTDTPPQPSAAPPAPQAGPRTVNAAQVGWLVRPNPIYPLRAKRAGNQGTAVVTAYVDTTGRPSQVRLEKSSGYPELDESALSSVRASQLNRIPEPMWVTAPIIFNLQ